MSGNNFSPEELMLLAQMEVTQNPGSTQWRMQTKVTPPTPEEVKAATKKPEPELPKSLVGTAPHFLGGSWDENKVAKDRFKRLHDSPWKVVDLETTGRTPYSAQVRTKDPAAGRLRARIISATWLNPDGTVESGAWDLDTMENSEKVGLAKACLTETFIAHNAAFDLGWLHHILRDAGAVVTDKLWPKTVLCTLHMSRQVFPESRRELRIAANNASDPRQEWIKNRLMKDRGRENWGNSLEDITYALNLPWMDDLDKSYQKPNNWVLPAPLSPGHFRYVQDDAVLPLVMVHRLLTDKALPLNSMKTQEEMILEAATWLTQNNDKLKEHPDLKTYFNVHHGAMKHVVNIAAKGMPYDMRLSEKYKQGMMAKILLAVDGDPTQPEKYPGINDINYPHLAPLKALLKDPQTGLNQELIEAWIKSFKQYDPDVDIPKTNTGEYSLSAKDLRRKRLDKTAAKPVYDLLNIIQKSKQAVKMIDGLDNFVRRAIEKGNMEEAQGKLNRGLARLHPLLGFGPGTDRLSSNDPNAQNFPRDPNFRALVRAKPGHKIISADYGQIELRIAAGLALRGQEEFNKLLANPDHQEPTKIGDRSVRQLKRLWEKLQNSTLEECNNLEVKMMEDEKRWDGMLKQKTSSFGNDNVMLPKNIKDMTYQELKDERDLRRLMVYATRIYKKRQEFNTDMYSALAIAFREGIDPHLFTGLAMAQQSNKDIGGPDPLSVIRAAKQSDKKFEEEFKKSGAPRVNEKGEEISMTPAADALKKKFKTERNNAKAVNFGLLYGMTAETLHMTGVVTYGSDWTLEEAQLASDAWFGLYPELGFWQYFTILRPEWEGVGQVCKVNMRNGTAKVDGKELRSWRATSLFGRTYVREAFREALNYQDQGTGAHLVYRAFELMPKAVKDCLIDQIHDEILCEAPEEEAEKIQKGLVAAMEKAGKEALGPYNIPVEAEAEMGDVWLHGDMPTIPLDPDVEWTTQQIASMAIPEELEDELDAAGPAM